LDHSTIHHAEISGIERHIHLRNGFEHTVEPGVGRSKDQAFLPFLAHAVNNIIPCAQLLHHLQQHFRRVLEVSIHDSHTVRLRMRDARIDRDLVAKIP
jgi:hypothetical protein